MKQIKILFSSALVLGLLFCSVLAHATDFTIYAGNLPPVTYPDKSGQVQGIAVDVLGEIMKEVGNPIDLSKIATIDWPKAMEIVEETPDTILFTAALTPEREYKFKFVGPVASLHLGLIARKDANIFIKNRSDVKKYSIASIAGSAPIAMLEAEYGFLNEDFVFVDTNEEQFQLLKDGKVDMITHTDMSTPVFMKEFGLAVHEYEMVHVLSKINLYYLFNNMTSIEFIGKLQQKLDAMKLSRFDVIVRKHLGDGPIYVKN